MVTVTGPSSNPTPIYNRSGVTIGIIAGSESSAAPTPIVRSAGVTVVLVTGNTVGGWVSLPSDAEIGDTVEIYPSEGTQTAGTTVVPQSSAVLINSYFTSGGCGVYRLLTDSTWGAIWSVSA